MTRYRLTDEQWELIADLFPPPRKTIDPRLVVDGILWILNTGSQWRDLPEEESCPSETIYGLYNAWTSDGLWNRILQRLQTDAIGRGAVDEQLWCVDGTIVRAHRCAANHGRC